MAQKLNKVDEVVDEIIAELTLGKYIRHRLNQMDGFTRIHNNLTFLNKI
jgi:hypothetical protein